jgi:8-oxo-dGTP diphosphatase
VKKPARVRRETSAGGVVLRRAGGEVLVLLIRDAHNNWGFPKGHLERGEAPSDAAVREVQEETGLGALQIIERLDTIEWTFRARGATIRKTCHFFALTTAEARTRPLRKEGITACRWVPLDRGVRMLTYDNARGVLRGARDTVALRVDAIAGAADVTPAAEPVVAAAP